MGYGCRRNYYYFNLLIYKMKRYFYNCYVISENGSQKFVTITHIVSSSLMPTQEEFIEKLNGPSKFIVCVRNMEDIVSSFEKLYRKNRAEFEINSESNNISMKTLKGRIELWSNDTGVIGSPYVSMIDAFNRGLGDRMLLVPYEGITYNPQAWMERIYEFIGEEYYQHDFNNIKQIYKENDEFFGWGDDLHTIKEGPVQFRESDAVSIIGEEWVEKLKKSNIWKN